MVSASGVDASPPKRTFTIGTRSSELALLQADIVTNALREARPDCKFEILSKKTAGDRNKVIALQEFNTKNLWTEELEELLIADKVDFIVHSLKGQGHFYLQAGLTTELISCSSSKMYLRLYRQHVPWDRH